MAKIVAVHIALFLSTCLVISPWAHVVSARLLLQSKDSLFDYKVSPDLLTNYRSTDSAENPVLAEAMPPATQSNDQPEFGYNNFGNPHPTREFQYTATPPATDNTVSKEPYVYDATLASIPETTATVDSAYTKPDSLAADVSILPQFQADTYEAVDTVDTEPSEFSEDPGQFSAYNYNDDQQTDNPTYSEDLSGLP